MYRAAKPLRATDPSSFRALRMALLIRNESWEKQCGRVLASHPMKTQHAAIKQEK